MKLKDEYRESSSKVRSREGVEWGRECFGESVT